MRDLDIEVLAEILRALGWQTEDGSPINTDVVSYLVIQCVREVWEFNDDST